MQNIKTMRLYRDLKISPLHTSRFILNDDYSISGVTIPKGFVSNGADIPKFLYPLLPPNDPLALPAVIMHDYLCDVVKVLFNKGASYDYTLEAFEFADNNLNKALMSLDVHPVRRKVYFLGVLGYTKFIRRLELFFYRSRNKDLPVYKRNVVIINNILNVI